MGRCATAGRTRRTAREHFHTSPSVPLAVTGSHARKTAEHPEDGLQVGIVPEITPKCLQQVCSMRHVMQCTPSCLLSPEQEARPMQRHGQYLPN